MDRNKILKFINEGKEVELLEQLELLGLNEYNAKFKQLIGILVVLLNNSKHNYLPIQQFLFKTIYKVLESILSSQENIKEFVEILSSNSDEDYNNISDFVGRFILNIMDDVDRMQQLKNIRLLDDALKQLNFKFLILLIQNQKRYESITNVFYNCIENLEEGRKIILQPNAISYFYEYVKSYPHGYLSHFIRPYYTGPTKFWAEYYLHVPEPFCEQIFKNNFSSFLDEIQPKAGSTNLLDDIRMFYKKAHSGDGNKDKVVMLFSNDNEQSENKDDHLKLLSKEHTFVRDSCIPPNYKSERPS